ncbi:MAG: ShlB/FhaC/HecB family hemolysin secretion/activation protein [Planctomycetaceae bacterium]|nr:MAG: ShlB/FhaC/HecB family hemolysin secretion/activation protein [Planctomycetaceae bacterium]
MTRWRWRWMLACLLTFLFGMERADAQNFERYRPFQLPTTPGQIPPIPRDQVEAASGSDEILVDRLNAVIIWDDPAAVEAENPFAGNTGVVMRATAGGPVLSGDALRQVVASYIGGPITLRRLNEMSREIILLYRRQGRPVVDVVIPEQKITAGSIQIVIVESRVGRVIIQGGCWTSTKFLPGQVQCTQQGAEIFEPYLREDLFRLNQYPFRRVELDLKPGDEEGTTDLIFQVRDVVPVRGYVGYDDTGVRALNYERLLAGVTVGGLLGADSLLSYQATTDGDFHRLNAHSLFYQLPLSQIWSFESYGAWAGLTPADVSGLTQDGEAWQAGFGLNRQLDNSLNRQSSWSAGFDFKSTNTNVEFGGTNVFASDADLVTLRLGYRLFERFYNDEYLIFRNDFFVGPGAGFTGNHNRESFETIRPGTSPDFVYNRTFFERMWNTPRASQLVVRGMGQLASERLLFSETLGLGGFDSLRGYDQRTLNADAGWILNFELGPRPWQTRSLRGYRTTRLYGFVDLGDAYVLDSQPGEVSQQFLASTGVGTRITMNDSFSLRVDYGYGFKETVDDARNHRVHVGLIKQFGPRP